MSLPCTPPWAFPEDPDDEGYAAPNGASNGSTPHPAHGSLGLDPAYLADATVVAAEGRQLEQDGIAYVVEGLLPAYGMLGFVVAFPKAGKSTFGLSLAECVATEPTFLGRAVTPCRVLVVAAEDPPEYVAWMARHLAVPDGRITFWRAPLILDAENLSRLAYTVQEGGYGLVLISSWASVIQGLVQGENDNAGMVQVVERVKAVARASGVLWLIDAHAGKGEDQDPDADPMRAMRGASAAAGAADFVLWLRLANGTFGTQRRLSGRGRFLSLAPMLLDYDAASGRYAVVVEESSFTETTWRLMQETGAVTTAEARSISAIAKLCYGVPKPNATQRRSVLAALRGRPVLREDGIWRKKTIARYRLVEDTVEPE